MLNMTRSVKFRQKTCVLILTSRKHLSSLSLRSFLNRRPSRIFLSCEKHITLELSRVSITKSDNKRNSFIVSVANRCRFVVILKFYACTVYSWLISMLKWAFYRQDVWKTPYFITHTVFKKIKVYILDSCFVLE